MMRILLTSILMILIVSYARSNDFPDVDSVGTAFDTNENRVESWWIHVNEAVKVAAEYAANAASIVFSHIAEAVNRAKDLRDQTIEKWAGSWKPEQLPQDSEITP